jgi:heme/copper-type cytochrome/quinol oxidase subunit 3
MEIPYIVEPRKDTGLFNSKVAIWLFLASEVMLFGGLFSAYIFLRIGADFPWPERVLPILPGLINTAILIASSVTVVFAWAELKLRNWRMFQVYMTITLLCAIAFKICSPSDSCQRLCGS